ncbi:MAG: VCBS domain-containing protein, partial [Pseudomonadota bacterium]
MDEKNTPCNPSVPGGVAGSRIVRHAPRLMALEQRFVFDGAAAADVAEGVDTPAAARPQETTAVTPQGPSHAAFEAPVAPPAAVVDAHPSTAQAPSNGETLFNLGSDHPTLSAAAQAATEQVREFLAQASDEQLFELFQGQQTQAGERWTDNLAQLRDAVANGTLDIRVVLLDNAQIRGALAAYSARGADDGPTVFINRDWLGVMDTQQLTGLLLEEYGHHLDHVLNQDADSAGDEGQRFAAHATGADTSGPGFALDDDHSTLQVDGESLDVEFATLAFTNAYEVNGATTPAGKETNSHDFVFTSLGAASINDDTNSRLFSGNDVAAIGINIGGNQYYGWISRPIKSGGIVRGFYFWTDNNFVSLAQAQADGNQDGDSNVADNRGFLLVVDQAYFDNLAWKNQVANLKNVGSSSDRVDAALNALVQVNVAPVAVIDIANGTPGTVGGAAQEAGGSNNGVAGFDAVGNVLSNDTDANVGDSRVVNGVGTTSASQGVSAATTSVNGTLVVGQYGSLILGADGSYRYVVDNTNTTVEALRLSGNSLTDSFTYRMVDASGTTSTTTLSVSIRGANDTPVANNDYNAGKESLRIDGTAYAANDPLGSRAEGNVLNNDTDKDQNGETRVVQAISIDGTATGTTAGSATFNTTLDTNDANSISAGALVYRLNSNGTRDQLFSGGVPVTVTGKSGTGNSIGFTFSDSSALIGVTRFSLAKNNGFVDGTINSTVISSSTTLPLTGVTGTIAEGMTVFGTGLATAPTVVKVNYDVNGNLTSVQLSAAVGLTNQALTFSNSKTAGLSLVGQYGTLVLNADGSYVYTPTANNPALAAGQSAVEQFAYSMQDASGATSNASLFITVTGSGTNDPNALADTATATEQGGTANGVAGANPSGNLLGNDTTPGGTNLVTAARASASAVNTVIGNSTQIVGLYGTLTLSSSGVYQYTLDNSNAAVQALRSNASTLTETFIYTVENGLTVGGVTLKDSSTLTITINGANDAPVAVNVAASATEAGGVSNTVSGYNPSGNVLSYVTDVDDAASELLVSAVRTGAVEGSGIAGTVGNALVGTYGSLTLNADGSWNYTVNNANALVNALDPGETLTESFNYTVTDRSGTGLSDIAVLTVTVQGVEDAIAVNSVFVNEASPYAVFIVTGSEGVAVNLALSDASGLAASDVRATLVGLSADIGSALEYYNGNAWVAYVSNTPVTLAASGQLLVRLAVLQDGIHEGNESFSLIATPTSGDASVGIGTINDEGEGDVYLGSNQTGAPDAPGGLDDDRPAISVSSVSVAEGAVAQFLVSLDKTSTAPVSFSPVLQSLSAVIGSDTAAASQLEYYNGSTWEVLSGPVTIAAGELSVMLRIATADDSEVESDQTFSLSTGPVSGTVTNLNGATGIATILDNDVLVPGTPTLDLDSDDSSTATDADYQTSYSENGAGVAIADLDISILDNDSIAMASATVVLTNAKPGDLLTINGSLPGGIVGSLDTSVAGQVTLTLSGLASNADYQSALAAIRFSNSIENPDISDRLIVVKVNDGSNESNTGLTTLSVIAVNDAPVAVDDSLNASEDTP